MDTIDFSKYKVEVIQPQPQHNKHEDFIQYLLGIINDRSIPERQKVDVRKQFDEILRMEQTLTQPPTIVLTPIEK